MKLKSILDNYGIVGVIGNYKNNIEYKGKIKDIPIKDIKKALKMVQLDETCLDKKIEDLTISELFKIELITKLEEKIIIIGNLSNPLLHKDKEYIKKLLIKLYKDYNKKIIIIDNDMKSFFGIAKIVCVVNDNKIIYSTDNFFDNNIYKYINMPKIVEFIKYINKNGKKLNETTDIYELIKDIYRSIS